MNIAIVSPSPKPFAVGGIEKLMLGLYYNIDKITNHKVELFKIPTEENSFWSLINSYRTFYNLNLDHFDMVITFKYPAWMVRHHNQVVYMAHHLRGLFDTYHFMNLPAKMNKTKFDLINEIIDYTNNAQNLGNDLDGFFVRLDKLFDQQHMFPDSLFSFPGPFIKLIIHFLDEWALHPSRIKRYTSISETVKARKDYFPRNVDIDVIYPPSSLEGLEPGSYDYFLVVGRLDGAKRVDLIINAMKLVDNPEAKLIIAGTGPEERKLKNLSQDDKRITFLGYINNEKLVSLYKDALGVVYIPYDEDYGLATIEAMYCKKPVITCKDSGGTTEFVQHQLTGLIADASPESLSKQLNFLINNKHLSMEMGERAFQLVREISWTNTIDKLLGTQDVNNEPNNAVKRKKMAVLSTYPVFPKQHGGQLRIYNLYYNLRRDFDITIVSLNDKGQHYKLERDGFSEISIPKSQKHQDKEWEIEREVGIPITDIAMQKLSQFTPEYHHVAKEVLDKSDILVASHPYLLHLMDPFLGEKVVIYDAHNVEYQLKKSMLPKGKMTNELLEDLYQLEKKAVMQSNCVFACSNEDINTFTELYNGVDRNKFILAPNGVDLSINQYLTVAERKGRKEQLGLINEKIVVFIGSWHKPNLEAVEQILKFAPNLPDCHFVIMGGQCEAFKGTVPPENVAFAGIVSEEMKGLIYSVADVAINPMINGSGTNLKIAEYMANGIPVISTEVGSRGYDFRKEHLIITDLPDFPQSINKLMNDEQLKDGYSQEAYDYIDNHFSWKKIAWRLKKIVTGM
ncbi:hypothetical protein AK95_05560 [Paenibacillus sp. LC231]|uniref:glycosyltransferase family 4 protein n=1 Tax=Paenibacillus sp. LC231 TaxID=1120679 RepID=UPI0008DE5813|nr:glycosyltransferase family 4 protein [Paenibacillus sp. LC231]OIB03078.1 hypothetical protein AK95_05560 [Paenibacillus sp. LC231]